jgi:hypothetical protein
MKVLWVSAPSDCEFDLTAALANTDVDLTWYCMADSADTHHAFHMTQVAKADNIKVISFGPGDLVNIYEKVGKTPCDLVIVRHPTWMDSFKKNFKTINELLEKSPAIEWTWEWIPNIALNQMPVIFLPRVAVTNSQDLKRCKSEYPSKQALYFPFGVRTNIAPQTDKDYECDLVSDAQPHYACSEYFAIKRQSVDIMIRPVLDKNLVLWGNRYGEDTLCDWSNVLDFAKLLRGTYTTMDYPKIYTNAKLYLGVSWNAPTGGFSIRLSRALGCGIPIIWQKTLGGEIDIPDPKVLAWTQAAQQTRNLVEHYLSHPEERIEMGAYGKKWGIENWEWINALKRLAKEIK